MVRRKTHEEFVAEVKKLVDDEYEILETYKNAKTKIKMKHLECNYEYSVLPNNFLRGNRCPKCDGKTRDTKQFKQDVYDLEGDNYQVLSDYISSQTYIKMKHNKCGNEWEIKPNNFLRGRRCPKCSRLEQSKRQTKTHDEFAKEVYNLVGNEYKIKSEYINADAKIILEHVTCGNIFKMRTANFLNGSRCPECKLRDRVEKSTKSLGQFNHEVYELVGNEYITLNEYTNSKTKVKMKHDIENCGYEWEVAPYSFLQGTRCPKCAGNIKKTHNQFVQEVFNIVGNEYEILSIYVNSDTKISMKHSKCGYQWDIIADAFLRGNRCPRCNGGVKNKTTEYFKQEVYNLTKDEYEVIGDYKNSNTKILMKHNKCKRQFKMLPNGFLGGKRCPLCRESKGEKKITELLNHYKIKFIPQYKFDDCIYKDKLKFDFAVFNYKNELALLIEYDGEQHFNPVNHFGGETKFKIVQIRDMIKNKYCKENGIYLLRIPHFDYDDIEIILEKELSNFIPQSIQ